MKKTGLLVTIAVILISARLYAAGDLFVGGNLTVTGDIIADKKIQAGARIVDTTTAIQVNFPVAFDTTPVVTASGVRKSAQPLFLVCILDVQPTYFTFRAKNLDGTSHAATSDDYVTWTAVAP